MSSKRAILRQREQILELRNSEKSTDVSIQSMTNTTTSDLQSTINQVAELLSAGCNTIRISTPTTKDVRVLQRIVDKYSKHPESPFFIADVHYDFRVALMAASVADRIRINPGNFLSKKETLLPFDLLNNILSERIGELCEICNKNRTSVRIGLNQGSIYKEGRILETADGMVEELLRYAEIFIKNSFRDIILSIKSSDPWMVIEANEKLKKEMDLRSYNFEIHLGVTEAGNGVAGRLKSALGIGNCLTKGIGDTIRVSLTEDPVDEIPVAAEIIELAPKARRILSSLPNIEERERLFDYPILVNLNSHSQEPGWQGDYIVSKIDDLNSPVSVIKWNDIENAIPITSNGLRLLSSRHLEENLILSAMFVPVLLKEGVIDGLIIEKASGNELEIAREFIEVSGNRQVQSNFISCPSCSRTNFDLESLTGLIKKEYADLNKNFSIMGCGVNGYGEMMKSDIGIIGSSKGKVDIYLKSHKVRSAIRIENVLSELNQILEK